MFARDSDGAFITLEFSRLSMDVATDAYAPISPSSSGYGKKIPTRYRVRCDDNRWRRVYCMIYSNSGTLWINKDGQKVVVDLD
jgi:hypothetical protein